MGKTYEEHLAEREAQNYASTRRWHPTPNVSAMRGEKKIAEFLGLPQDLRNKPGGDGGIDYLVLLEIDGKRHWHKVDVKAATHQTDPQLKVPAKDLKPDTIYVLYADAFDELRGWMWGHEIKAFPLKTVITKTGHIVTSHWVEHGYYLKSMASLKSMILEAKWSNRSR